MKIRIDLKWLKNFKKSLNKKKKIRRRNQDIKAMENAVNRTLDVSYLPSLSSIISGFIVILIGVSLIKPMSEQITLIENSNSTAISPFSSTILSTFPLFFVIGIIFISIVIAWRAFRNAGFA